MKIEYNIFIKDTLEGYELFYGSFEDVFEAIEKHKHLVTRDALKKLIETKMQDYLGEIDQYYLNNPHKRFEVVLEVGYDE